MKADPPEVCISKDGWIICIVKDHEPFEVGFALKPVFQQQKPIVVAVGNTSNVASSANID